MITMKRKTISILLAIMLVVTLVPPAFAFADDTPAEDGQVTLMGTEDGEQVEPLQNIADYAFRLSQNKFFDGQPQKPAVICDALPGDAYYVNYSIENGWWGEGTYAVYIYGNESAGYYGSVTLYYQIVRTSIELDEYDVTIYRKGTYQLYASVYEPNGQTTWTSSNTKVATVTAAGKVTAKAKGTATIRVQNGNAWETVVITVMNPYLNKKSLTIDKGKTAQLKVNGKIGKATFKTSNKKIATVSASGKIKAKKIGKCTITVKSNGITMKCNVKVKKKSPVRVYITRTGKRYHCDPDCWGLRNAWKVWKVSLKKAKKKKLTKCHVCY